ncbi:hypothetical protein [Shewanella nanhaiensis]|uniref:Cytochrome C n=1 Tax=Shewanella nanhaiensis TaxID=2864872 RepID=A0ABS7E2Q5_9GAMM|nr:hypothetical protein [Shewanella nanhaiensis]MBW8183917.1 hypothetical protein [Shewanella nanhaiensis]
MKKLTMTIQQGLSVFILLPVSMQTIAEKRVSNSGRSELCIACHAPLNGTDREVLNGRAE